MRGLVGTINFFGMAVGGEASALELEEEVEPQPHILLGGHEKKKTRV